MREKLKRVFPVVASVSLVLCMIAAPLSASAASSRQVLDLDDLVIGTTEDSFGYKWNILSIPRNYCAVQTIDVDGSQYLPSGTFSGSLVVNSDVGSESSLGAYWPGCVINQVYLDATDLPDGAIVDCDVQFSFSDLGYQTDVQIVSMYGIHYFDKNFNFISAQRSEAARWYIDGSEINGNQNVKMVLEKPSNAVYFGFYLTFNLVVTRSNDTREIQVDWYVGNPRIQTTTSHIDNEIVDEIVKSRPTQWLLRCASAFLELEIAPGFPISTLFYIVLVSGVLMWFIKMVS